MALSDIIKKLKDVVDRDKELPGVQLKKGGLVNSFAKWGLQNFPHPQQNESFQDYMKRGMGALGKIGLNELKGVASVGTLGLYKPKTPELSVDRIAQNLGKLVGSIGVGNVAYSKLAPQVANWGRLPRIATTITTNSALAAATEPGSLQERGKTFLNTMTNPLNIGLSTIAPISGEASFGGRVNNMDEANLVNKSPQVKTPSVSKTTDDIIQKLDETLKATNKRVQATPKSQGFWQKTFKPSLDVLASQGKTGKKIANTIRSVNEQTDFYVGKYQKELYKALRGLDKNELSSLADVIEGNAKPISPRQAYVAKVWKNIADSIHKDAREAGIDIGKIEQYFPHLVPKEIKPTGRTLGRMAQRKASWEFKRKSDLPYLKDPNVLFKYIEDMGERIVHAKHFGVDDRKLYRALGKIAKEGGDADLARKIVDQILNKNVTDSLRQGSKIVRNIETLKLGPSSALTNLTQNISTASRTGFGTTLKSIIEIARDPQTAIMRAIEVGEIDPQVGVKMVGELQDLSPVGRWLKLVGFTTSEKINRMVATTAGETYTRRLIEMARNGSDEAMRELNRLGFKTLEEANPLVGAKRISEMTQFNTRTGELPYWAQTPLGRVAFQFKGFAYKQTKFIFNELNRSVEELSKGNAKPLINNLITYGIAAPLIGEIVADLKSIIKNKKRGERGVKRYIADLAAATSLGLIDELPALFGKYKEGGIISSVGGPAAGDVYRIFRFISNIGGDKYEKRKAVRAIAGLLPGGFGSTISNTLVPNKYIENVWGGTNVGLGDKEKKVYLKLKQQSPEKAEQYKVAVKVREESKKPSLLTKLFGGDKKVEIAVKSKDYSSLSQDSFNSLYSKAVSIVKGYETQRDLIVNDPTLDEATKQEKLLALDEKYQAYKRVLDDMGKNTDKVFKAELKTYSSSHGNIKVKQRAEWAAEKIKSAKDDKERRKLIQQMIDAGVLTTGSRGTIRYLKDVLGINIYSYGTYTKDGKTLGGKKKVRLKRLSSGQKLRLTVAKAPKTVSLPKVKINVAKPKKSRVTITQPVKIESPKLSKAKLKLSQGYKPKKIKVKLAKVR